MFVKLKDIYSSMANQHNGVIKLKEAAPSPSVNVIYNLVNWKMSIIDTYCIGR